IFPLRWSCTVCLTSAGITAMTCSRVTPAFTVRMTITPVVVGEVVCAWAADEWDIEVAPTRVRVSAKATLRIAFIDLGIGVAPDLQIGGKTGFRERLLAIMLMGYEAELHSQAACARRRRGISQRRAAPKFPQSCGRARRDDLRGEPGRSRTGGACRRGALHSYGAKRWTDRSWRALPRPREAGVRGARVSERGSS